MSSTISAAVYDCEGARVSLEERAFFRDANPFGFILFARHCSSADAVRTLCAELRDCVGRNAPILIDQEGGRVQRMKPPAFPDYPAPAAFGELWRLDRARAREAARLNARLIAAQLSALGVDVNCAPSLDVPQIDADPATVGDRTLARHSSTISELGAEALAGAMEGGVLPVIKHMPGLGRVLLDSHHALPRVAARREDLEREDFAPFRALADAPAGMTAHVVYEAIDPDAPGTHSRIVIDEIIRGEIGFDGLLFTDDLKMQALSGDYASRARRALAAGCDVAVICNLELRDKASAAEGVSAITAAATDRAARAATRVAAASRAAAQAGGFEPVEARRRLDALLKPALAV